MPRPPSILPAGKIDAEAPSDRMHVTPAHSERCCLCHSPTLRPWITRFSNAAAYRASFVEELWSPALMRLA
jgi:hypothetical protein